jgi:predicted amidohydrolase YtcJ
MRLPTLLAALIAPALAIAQPAPSLILHNGRVFTADPGAPWAEAVAISGERITAVGSNAAVLVMAGDGTRLIDVEGRLVIPGLNDAHVHAGAWPETVRLDFGPNPMPDPSLDQVTAAITAAVETAPAGSQIHGTIGSTILEDPDATRFALDAVSRGHAVFLWGWTGHGMIFNTAALQFTGIGLDAADPPGGRFARRDGVLTGRLDEYAGVAASRRLSAGEGHEASVAAYRRLAERAARFGITSVQLMSTELALPDALSALRDVATALRWDLYHWPMPEADVEEGWALPPTAETGIPRVSVAGVKWMLDGTPVERGALMRQPYSDRPNWRGVLNFPPADVRRILQASLDRGEQPAFHVSGDSAVALVLRTMAELAPAERWRPLRVRLEHGDGLAPDLIPLAADLGVVLVQNPLHLTLPDIINARVGDRASGYQLLRTPLEAGVAVALGSDAGGEGFNPFLNLMMAVVDPMHPDDGLSPEQAVLAYTRGAAYAQRAEDAKGTIRVGMLADLAVLSQNLFEVSPNQWPATESVFTVVGGEIVYEAAEVMNDE